MRPTLMPPPRGRGSIVHSVANGLERGIQHMRVLTQRTTAFMAVAVFASGCGGSPPTTKPKAPNPGVPDGDLPIDWTIKKK